MLIVILILSAFVKNTCCLHPEPRIIDGIPTTTDEYPWMASIQWHWSDGAFEDSKHYCSGTLIRSTYPAAVLTAGHCVGDEILGQDGRHWHVDIGRTYAHDDVNNSFSDFITFRAFYYYLFEGYEDQLGSALHNLLTDYDIGIVLLDGSVDDIEPITLYNASDPMHSSRCCEDNQTLRALGYGYIDSDKTDADTLRYLDMNYMSDVWECSEDILECADMYDNFKISYKDVVEDDGSAICAQQENAGICQGDSGGPLVYIDVEKGEVIQIGIGSQSCCIPGVPNMFANVDYFFEGIQEVLEDNSSWIPYLNSNDSYTENVNGSGGKIPASETMNSSGKCSPWMMMMGLVPMIVIVTSW